MEKTPENITIQSLFSKEKDLAFLVGSGISLDAPSNLPTGYQFTKYLLERIIPEEEQTLILELMNPDRPDIKSAGDFLRFEQLMEIVQHEYDPDLQILDIFANAKTPNFNHLFLAEMIKKGQRVSNCFLDFAESCTVRLKLG